jgi:hypothetical protein
MQILFERELATKKHKIQRRAFWVFCAFFWPIHLYRCTLRVMSVDTGNHETSLAVWDLASPLVINRPAKMKVGVKCSDGCELSGTVIEIQDAAGRMVACAQLGSATWPGTTGLYWAELDFIAPATAGTNTWAVRSPHGDAFSNVTFITVQPPDHSVTISIRDRATHAPIPGVEVRLDMYRASSDDQGLAKIELPKGCYTLTVWKMGYTHFSTVLDLTGTVVLHVEIEAEPEQEQPYWM